MLYLYYTFCAFVLFVVYLFGSDLMLKRSGGFKFNDLSSAIETKWDNIIMSTYIGLIFGSCVYAHKVSDMFTDNKFQIFAFWAGVIAGPFLLADDFYQYHDFRLALLNSKK